MLLGTRDYTQLNSLKYFPKGNTQVGQQNTVSHLSIIHSRLSSLFYKCDNTILQISEPDIMGHAVLTNLLLGSSP